MVGDIEDVKHAILLILASATFTTALTAVDAEKRPAAGARATPGPASLFDYETRTMRGQPFPIGEVIGIRSVYGMDAQAKAAVHEVQIVWTQVGDSEQLVTQ